MGSAERAWLTWRNGLVSKGFVRKEYVGIRIEELKRGVDRGR